MFDPDEWDGVEVTENGETVVWTDCDGELHVEMAEEWEEATILLENG